MRTAEENQKKSRKAKGDIVLARNPAPSHPETVHSEGTGERSTSFTHEQVSERARMIWQNHGCTSGRDEANWYEAEAQLLAELEGVWLSVPPGSTC